MVDDQITIPFVGGIDEATDPRVLPPGSLVAAVNPVFSEDGQYQTRYGVTMLGTVRPSSVFRLAVFLSELIAIDLLGGCWSYAPNASEWVQRDTLPAVQVTHQPLYNSTSSFTSWDSVTATFSGLTYRTVAWIDGADNTPHAAVYDGTTGALLSIVQLSTHASTNVNIGVINGGAQVVVVAADNGAANIRGYSLNLASLGSGWSAGTVMSAASYASTAGVYACDFTATTPYLAWEHVGSPTSAIELHAYSVSLVSTSSTTITTSNSNSYSSMAMRATDGELAWIGVVAHVTSSATHLFLASATLPSFGTTTLQNVTPNSTVMSAANTDVISRMGIERVSATQCVFVVDRQGQDISYAQFTTAAQVGVAMGVPYVGLGSAPFFSARANTTYCYFRAPYDAGNSAGYYYAVDLLTGTTASQVIPAIQSVLAPTIVNIGLDANNVQVNVPRPSLNGTSFETVMPIVRGAKGRQGLELFSMAQTSYAQAWAGAATLGKELYLGGCYYDGNRGAEIGISVPRQMQVSNVSGTGSTYSYCMTYARIDAQGNLEESAPGNVVTVTSGGPPNVDVFASYWWLTRKQRLGDAGTSGPLYILIYRTQAAASGDSTFYRLTAEPFPVSVVNSLTATTLTYNDTLSDASLTDGTHPVLYTMTGELPHDQPESFVAATVHKNRVWGIGADQRTIWFSQTYSDGVLPAWSDANQITVDDAGEPLTCLASLYDKLLIFTRTKVYVVFGDGPSPAGTGSDLTEPQRVPSLVGCIDPRSIVTTPLGIMFHSTRGIELIDPNLNIAFIGQRVQLSTSTAGGPSTAASLPFGSPTPMGVCVGACYDGKSSTVRFAFCSAEGTDIAASGCVVVYDVRRDRWAVHSITQGGTGGTGALAQMSAIANHPTLGVCMAHQDSANLAPSIYRENTVADTFPWLDFGTYFVPLTLQTAWLKAQDLEGWQSVRRIRLLAQYYDNHGLLLSLLRDYQGVSASEFHTFADTTINAFISGSWEQMALVPGATRRGEALQVTLHSQVPVSTPLNSGRGCGFTGLAFEVKRQRGGYRRLSSSQRS